MKTISTMFYSEKKTNKNPILLVNDTSGMDIDEWVQEVKDIKPLAVIPPYNPEDAQQTARYADMAKSRITGIKTGVVVAGKGDKEREEFFLWAQANGYSPIVLLPHRSWTRQRQIMQLAVSMYIERDTWIHLPEPVLDFNPDTWPGTYTTGIEFVRFK